MRWLLLVLLFALVGCRKLSYVQLEAVPASADVVEGQTRYGEVLAEFGAPLGLAEVPGGFAMFYERISIVEGHLGLKTDAGYFGGARGGRQYASCVLLFADDGVLYKVMASDTNLDTGLDFQAGTSGQAGTIGNRDYGEGTSPFNWGRRMMNPLPIALNEKWSRIEIGEGVSVGRHLEDVAALRLGLGPRFGATTGRNRPSRLSMTGRDPSPRRSEFAGPVHLIWPGSLYAILGSSA